MSNVVSFLSVQPRKALPVLLVQDDCNIGDHPELPWWSQRVIYSVKRVSGWFPGNPDINEWIHSKVKGEINMFSNFIQLKAVLQSFGTISRPVC